jgi:preprotein translocase subunit YajC
VEALIPLLFLFVLFWLLFIRPQRKRNQRQNELLTNIAPGQQVLTAGGLYGTIREVQDDSITLEIAPGTSVRLDKRAVTARVEEPSRIASQSEENRS